MKKLKLECACGGHELLLEYGKTFDKDCVYVGMGEKGVRKRGWQYTVILPEDLEKLKKFLDENKEERVHHTKEYISGYEDGESSAYASVMFYIDNPEAEDWREAIDKLKRKK